MRHTVRVASPQDVPRLAEMITQLGYPVDEAAAQIRLQRWTTAPQSQLLVCETDGTATGLAAWHLLPRLERDGSWARLAALVVAETHRGQGLGRNLIEAVESAAAAHGANIVEVTSNRERAAAHAFYRKLGYRDRCAASARFLKPLPSHSPAAADFATIHAPDTYDR